PIPFLAASAAVFAMSNTRSAAVSGRSTFSLGLSLPVRSVIAAAKLPAGRLPVVGRVAFLLAILAARKGLPASHLFRALPHGPVIIDPFVQTLRVLLPREPEKQGRGDKSRAER